MSIRVRKYPNRKSYQASLRLNGRRLARSFERKTDADRWLRSNLEKRGTGELSRTPQITLAEFSHEWYQCYKLNVKPNTFKNADKLLRLWILPAFGFKRLDQVTPQDLKRLMAVMLERGRAPRTANYALAILRKPMNDAIHDWGFSLRNPAARLKPLHEGTKRVNFWNASEAAQFLEVVERESPSELALFRFLLNTGSRIGEACALFWEDVDLEKGSVCIRRNMDWHALETRETTKSGKLRFVGLNEGLKRELKNLFAKQGQPSDSSLVFPNQVGKPRCLQNLFKRSFCRCIQIAKIKQIKIHDLRHTFAAHYVMNGGSIYDLKQILGHSEIKMTERYAHLTPDYLMKQTTLVNF